MVLFNVNITDVESAYNTPISNFAIVSIKSSSRNILCKVDQTIEGVPEKKIIYFSYYPRTMTEQFLFLEIFNESPLWQYKCEYVQSVYTMNTYRFTVKIAIDADKLLLPDFLNSSLALNTLISSIFDEGKQHPVFDKTDFSSKSFVSYEDPVNPPNNFKIKLYDYQKKSLAKMLKMEKGDTSFTVKYTSSINIEDQEYNYDPVSNQRVVDDKFLKINIRGGILSDEMGLGKTITSIALIATNPASLDHPAAKYSNSFQIDKLFTKATLVLCPSHLTTQWKTEITRCNPQFKVLLIVTKKDMDKLTVSDVQESDIIITSHQFLMNFKYYPSLHYRVCTATNYSFQERKQTIKAFLSNLWKDEAKLLALETPIFEFFYFHRIILDEGHEIFGEMLGSASQSRYMSEWVSSIDANNYWYISGTPFINFVGVKNCSRFINLKLIESDMQLKFDYSEPNNQYHRNANLELFSFLNKEYIWNNIFEKICIRHRKTDVMNQIQIPGYEEKLIWIKFTDLEKNLYEAKKGKVPSSYLQQLCCHPMVIDSMKSIMGNVELDLSLMQDKLIDHHKKNHEFYKNKLALLDPKKQEYHMLKKSYENASSESLYMFTILTTMKNKPIDENENRSICLDALEDPTLTACGHIFCYECLKMCLGDKKKCPMCKADLTGKEILTTKKIMKPAAQETNPLIVKYGSKLGKTISIIRTLVAQEDTRIIIFSQWDDMLSLIGKTLIENGIENSFVKGNVWSRNSAINKFKAGANAKGDDNKVIMLSLKNAASGTTLTEATHIIFVEPINSSPEERRAIEGQAIGRACRIGQKNKVSVIRILLEGTIEEEIYKKVYNKDAVVEFKKDEETLKDLGVKVPKELVV
jgi:SNF2 family DNA or RNA helicase